MVKVSIYGISKFNQILVEVEHSFNSIADFESSNIPETGMDELKRLLVDHPKLLKRLDRFMFSVHEVKQEQKQ